MDNVIEIRKIIQLLFRHIVLIIASMLICAAAGFGIARFLVTPQYSASMQILINQQKKDGADSDTTYAAQQTDAQLVSTYEDLITNQLILREVSRNLAHPIKVVKKAQASEYTQVEGQRQLVKAASPAITKVTGTSYNISPEKLKQSITVNHEENSQMFTIDVVTNGDNKSVRAASELGKVFKKDVKKIMNVDNVTIVANPINSVQTSPNTQMFIIAGAVTGILLSVGYLFTRELLDTTVKDDQYLVESLKLTNLGHIDRIEGSHELLKEKENNGEKRVDTVSLTSLKE